MNAALVGRAIDPIPAFIDGALFLLDMFERHHHFITPDV
jgi:hypothetical protein